MTSLEAPAAAGTVQVELLRPLIADALSSVDGAIAREKSRVPTVALLRARADLRRLAQAIGE